MRKHLGDLARAAGKTKDEKEQKAGVVEGQTSDFVVGYNPDAKKVAAERLKKFDDLAKDKNLDKKLAEEGHGLLLRMPKLEAQQNLRKAYQKFVDAKLDVSRLLEAERKDIMESTVLSEKRRQANSRSRSCGPPTSSATRVMSRRWPRRRSSIATRSTGLYKSVDREKVPSDLKERVDKVKDMKDADLLRLLTDARQQLGKREDLGKGQDVTHALDAMLAKLDQAHRLHSPRSR